MFGPWLETFAFLRGLVPSKIGHPHFNFITLHCMARTKHLSRVHVTNHFAYLDMYLISMTIVGSVILYPTKNMAYIDCLFFASGAATQSGLNT